MGWLSLATRILPKVWRAGTKATSSLCMLDHPEESAGTAVGKTVRSGVDGSGDFLHDAVNGFTGDETVEEVMDTTTHVVNDLKETVAESKNVLGSLGNTLQGLGSSLGVRSAVLCLPRCSSAALLVSRHRQSVRKHPSSSHMNNSI